MSLNNFLSQKSGFSLVEIGIALGIIAFALVGIMALFPVGIRSARESWEETRSTFLARQIFSDLMASEPGGVSFVGIGKDIATTTNRLGIHLPTNSNHYLLFDWEGMPLGTNPPAAFPLALPETDAAFAVRLEVSTNGWPAGLSRVEVRVTTPAAAPLTNRSGYSFVTLLRNR